MRRLVALVPASWLFPAYALASGGEPATALEHHVDTSRLSGVNLLLGQLYNDHRLLYAVVSTATMATLGIVIAFAVDMVLGQFGVHAKKGEHRE